MNKERGFTLVELVVVIVLLGILSAAALPRFINVTDNAYAAAYDGTVGAFQSSASLFRAQWVATGNTGAVDDLANFGDGTVDSTTNGWPTGTDGSNTFGDGTDCTQLWTGLLGGSAPEISVSANVAGLTALTSDYGTIRDSATQCTYYYLLSGNASGDSVRNFSYSASNGSVTVNALQAL